MSAVQHTLQRSTQPWPPHLLGEVMVRLIPRGHARHLQACNAVEGNTENGGWLRHVPGGEQGAGGAGQGICKPNPELDECTAPLTGQLADVPLGRQVGHVACIWEVEGRGSWRVCVAAGDCHPHRAYR